MLALFFAGVAVLLAAIGLYGVLDYNVMQRRRELGIRIAIGARPGHIVRKVTADTFLMVAAGAIAGIGMGRLSTQYIETLLYGVKANDPSLFAVPALTILFAALLASLPAVVRAVRVDPVSMVRSE